MQHFYIFKIDMYNNILEKIKYLYWLNILFIIIIRLSQLLYYNR